jgi:hypothetical protein
MAFLESLRLSVKQRAHFRCCLCHGLGVEIHHIEPQLDGGADTDDNAAPLCPTCHETWGANPTKRKFIREARDFWYDLCSKRYASDPQQLGEIREQLQHLATKDDVERLAVRNVGVVLGSASNSRNVFGSYSFDQDVFVHPLIVRELLRWVSDPLETVVAVDLTSANDSNRFFGEFLRTTRDGRPWIEWTGNDDEWFAYAPVATSPSGIHMVRCYNCTGGTGVFGSLGLFSFEHDVALGLGNAGAARTRLLLKTLGSITLGDRYFGEIVYSNGTLAIGPDEGSHGLGQGAARTLRVS